MAKIYIVIHESGEYSSMDSKVVMVSPSRDFAFRHAWLTAFNGWYDGFYVEDWDMHDDSSSVKLATFSLDSTRLRKTYVSSVLADIQARLMEETSGLPEMLEPFTTKIVLFYS